MGFRRVLVVSIVLACVEGGIGSSTQAGEQKTTSTSSSRWEHLSSQGFVLWFYNPWISFTPSDLPTPNDMAKLQSKSVTAYMGEKIPLALMVSNGADYMRAFRVSTTDNFDHRDPKPIAPGEFPPDCVTFREVVFVEARSNEKKRFSMPDALPLLNEANLLQVGPRQTRQLWINLDTKELAAGDYQLRIIVRAVEDCQSRAANSVPQEMPFQAVTVRVKVLPLVMPSRPNLDVVVWEYERWILGPHGKAIVEDMTQNGAANVMVLDINTDGLTRGDDFGKIFQPGWTPSQINFSKMDKIIDLKKGPGRKFIIWNMVPWFDEQIYKVKTEKGKEICVQWIKACVDHLKQRGMNYDDFMVEIQDEVAESTIENAYIVAKGLKEIDPKVKIFQTVGDGARFEDIKRLAPYVDIWCVWDCRLGKTDELEFMKRTGKDVWIYRCSTNSKVLSPVGYQRCLPLMTWRYQFKGCGIWSYDFGTGNLWDDLDTKDWSFGDSTLVYPGRNGPIPSKRWEGWCRGMDDYKALEMLDGLIRKAEGRSDCKELCVKGKYLLNQGIKDLLDPIPPIFLWDDMTNVVIKIERIREQAAVISLALQEKLSH